MNILFLLIFISIEKDFEIEKFQKLQNLFNVSIEMNF